MIKRKSAVQRKKWFLNTRTIKKYRLLNEARWLRELEDNINLVCYPKNHLGETQSKFLIFLAIDLQSV